MIELLIAFASGAAVGALSVLLWAACAGNKRNK
nr:MAG TPA: YtxH-like protein [Caudoviricetes sp.]